MAGNAYITPEQIRLFLLDRGAGDNFLLGDQDFESESLNLAMQMAVDLYNTTTPILEDVFQVIDFPYRAQLILGTSAFLLLSKGSNMMRNSLNYTSQGGTAVNDKQTAEQYLSLSKMLKDEYVNQIKSIKQHNNIEAGYGYVWGIRRGGA